MVASKPHICRCGVCDICAYNENNQPTDNNAAGNGSGLFWFDVVVQSRTTDIYIVQAKSPQEAKKLYVDGEASWAKNLGNTDDEIVETKNTGPVDKEMEGMTCL